MDQMNLRSRGTQPLIYISACLLSDQSWEENKYIVINVKKIKKTRN